MTKEQLYHEEPDPNIVSQLTEASNASAKAIPFRLEKILKNIFVDGLQHGYYDSDEGLGMHVDLLGSSLYHRDKVNIMHALYIYHHMNPEYQRHIIEQIVKKYTWD